MNQAEARLRAGHWELSTDNPDVLGAESKEQSATGHVLCAAYSSHPIITFTNAT